MVTQSVSSSAPRWLPALCGIVAAGLSAAAGVRVLGDWTEPVDLNARPKRAIEVETIPFRTPEPRDSLAQKSSTGAVLKRESPASTSGERQLKLPEYKLPALDFDEQQSSLASELGTTLDWRPIEAVIPFAEPATSAPEPLALRENRAEPRPRFQPDLGPYYPWRARRRGTEGETTVRIAVDREGRVRVLEIVASRPTGVFEKSARRAASTLRYDPAVRDGEPVATETEVVFVWKLE